ncbi:MAG: carbohydrate-binding domain-containing protein, partial [Ignavibacterium sp.]|nr:carbohydrate-binding domain-containing protein [Ignavibacterium sp.]MDW8374734.1 carbohydrate-binding domain-containing protein [Ignavibacteriales bacterium]
MKKIPLLFALISIFTFPQSLQILKKDGQSQQISISEIDSITFTKAFYENIVGLQKLLLNNSIRIHSQNQTTEMFVYQIDSIYFNSTGTIAYFKTKSGIKEFNINRVDSITFSSMVDSTIFITYNDTNVSVVNPYLEQGVSVLVQGADVTVNSSGGLSDLNYVLNGTTNNGSFKIYSDKKFNLKLNNIQITNPDGAAINIQSTKKITVHLIDNTNNILTDGLNYLTPPNNEEEDAAFYSEGQLIFTGNGNLIINGIGNDKHGICSDDYIEILSGNIKINSSK